MSVGGRGVILVFVDWYAQCQNWSRYIIHYSIQYLSVAGFLNLIATCILLVKRAHYTYGFCVIPLFVFEFSLSQLELLDVDYYQGETLLIGVRKFYDPLIVACGSSD